MTARVHPVVHLPPWREVLDLSLPPERRPAPSTPWTIGRYDEVRTIYTQALFGRRRTLHVGLDLGAPPGVAVHAPLPGRVLHAGINPAPGDYGPTLVTEHEAPGLGRFWILFGHLDPRSLEHSPPGRCLAAGDVIGWIGAPEDNGGWPPHVHVQLARHRPATHDLPGVVDPAEREEALRRFPDPRLLLGPLY